MKTAVSDLAVLGGPPLFKEALHVGRPNLYDREALFHRLGAAADRLWFTNDGPLLLEMEETFARFFGVRHCVAVANATLGLQLVAHALGLKGDVLMPAFTFIGTARAIEWQGARPVFCDVLPDRHTLDPAAVRAAMTSEVCAILGVHLWGRPCEIDELQRLADDHGVPLIFDAAHAVGSVYRGQRIGCFGRAEVFSLHATKIINGLEGGLVTTNDDELAHRIDLARNYGILDEDVFDGTGINAKMNEFSAAMALSNLEGYDFLVRHNRRLQLAYREGLGDAPGIAIVSAGSQEHSGHYAVLQVSPTCALSRDELRDVLIAENVKCRRYFWPGCHRCPPYDKQVLRHGLPVTERLAAELVQLPTGLQLDDTQAFEIGHLLALAVEELGSTRGRTPGT